MKIKKIRIKNFRSIKDDLIIDNIWDILVLTWENNSWKSSIINAIAIFLWYKKISERDFHKWENVIEIELSFSNIEDEYLLKFAEYKKLSSQITVLKRDNELFSVFTKTKIDKKEDLDNQEQITFIEQDWLSTYKADNNIIDWEITILLKILLSDLKTLDYVDKKRIERIFPNLIFIDDERNFSDEQDWKNWSITEKIFKWIEIKNECVIDFDDLNNKIISWEKNINDLDIFEIEALLKKQINNKSERIWVEISKNFSSFYDSWFKIDVIWNTDISHKTFSLKTQIYDPNLDEKIDLNNVWAWLRALYLLSLLKAYNSFQKNENTIFIIEEPELYLHPWLQKRMAEILDNISKEQQLFFTTHSPIILRKFDLENVKEIRRENNTSKKYDSSLNDILWKLWYSIFDIIDFEYIIFVEWISDIFILEKIINKFHSWKKVKIIEAWDCNSLSTFAHFKFLQITRDLRDKFILIRDWDNQNVTELQNILRNKLNWKVSDIYKDEVINNKYKILDRYSIENFFFNEDILKIIKTDFSIEDFINKAEEFIQTKERWKESLKSKQIDFYNDFRIKFESNFYDNIKLVRWHNIMDCLLYYIYWEVDFFKNKKSNYELFISSYINNSQKTDFWVLTQYLDELFWITN